MKTRVSKLNLWFKHYLNDGCSTTFLNKTESARRAGYKCNSYESFRNVGHQNYTKLADKICAWLDDNGLSENTLKLKMLSLMEAKETKFFSHEGVVTDEREIAALEIQRKTLDMALKVKDMNAPTKHELTGKDGKALMPQDAKITVEYCEPKTQKPEK